MRKIIYLGYYAPPNNAQLRHCEPAGVRKMDYIWSAIVRNRHEVEIVSACGSRRCLKGACERVAPGVWVKYFATLGTGIPIRRCLSRWCTKICLFFYLLFTLKKSSVVIAYHSLGYMGMIKLLKKWKKFKLILEVEEIYADVIGNKSIRKQELDFFPIADAYIFPTELLDEIVNQTHKPSCVVYGSYQVEEQREDACLSANPDHSERHLLYAGTFDPRKGGAYAAAEAAAYLPAMYRVHIAGFGSDKDTLALRAIADKVNAGHGAKIIMEGFLAEKEYAKLIQQCDAGFCTQTPKGMYNNTSFPSKVLSYLANGLRVISVRIPALERARIGHLLTFYDGDSPEAIADAVQCVDWNQPYDSRLLIRELDEQFITELGNLLSSVEENADDSP